MKCFSKTAVQRSALSKALWDVPSPSTDADRPQKLLERCPAANHTPLLDAQGLADLAGVGKVLVKDERQRMGLGSFKALGAAYVIANDAEIGLAKSRTYVTASAGNHGLSVAAGAEAFGAKSVIYLATTVPEVFAEKLRSRGAEVRRHGDTYELSMEGAAKAAKDNGWMLLSDSSWPDYFDVPRMLMEGYLVLMKEAAQQIAKAPTHIFLQAGVGGMAAACAAYARHIWGLSPRIVVVEPDAAPALFASVQAGSPQITTGPSSDMGRLDCKEPSLIALKGLAEDATDFMLISEDEGQAGLNASIDAGLPSTSSGAAGFSGLLSATNCQPDLGLSNTSEVLIILSEEAT